MKPEDKFGRNLKHLNLFLLAGLLIASIVLRFVRLKNYSEIMTMKDEVLTELWKTKDSISEENNHDINKLMIQLKDLQTASKRTVVNRLQNNQVERIPTGSLT